MVNVDVQVKMTLKYFQIFFFGGRSLNGFEVIKGASNNPLPLPLV